MALLERRIVVVTGAARGIGRAISEAVCREGAHAVLVDRLGDELSATAKALSARGGSVEAQVCDLADEAAVTGLFDGLLGAHGRIDGLVNNAGTTVYGGSIDTSLDELMRVLRIHLAPTLLCAQVAARAMLSVGRGRIVNMASAAAEAAVTRLFGYSMAKAAVVSMTRHMAAEWGSCGVTVNALAPGPVLTEALRANQNLAVQQALRDGIPMDRFAEPAEVAGAAVFLLSDLSSYVNGHVLAVDGGLLAVRTRLDRITAS